MGDKIISQVKQAPYTEIDIMAANDVSGATRLSTIDTTMPMHDIASALTGMPRRLTRPNAAGACPARDSENIMRVVIYSWLFIADNAATSTIKLKIPAAAGKWITFIAIRNGLSPVPDWRQGTMASIRAIDSM
ncbi:hypothetical protein AK51_25830 [Serratia nematodiphila DZ0503SBS1]|nr:hypothetical protein AK51_25830 [Serratia nematodiphila DZ0503SBS1]